MGKILTLNKPSFGKEPPKVKATIIFQDANYTFMRNKEELTQEDILNVPLHLFLIALGMLDANQYVPKVGKKAYLETIAKLKKQFTHVYNLQKKMTNAREDKEE